MARGRRPLLVAAISALGAAGSSSSDGSPQAECDVEIRLYRSSSSCLGGFSSEYEALHFVIADGECRDSGSDELGYYVATCDGDTDWFRLARSGCADESCEDCAETDAFYGRSGEGGCNVHWTVSDAAGPGSTPFPAVADGECRDSGIVGLGHYVADCRDGGDWLRLSRAGCADECCEECTKTSDGKTSLAQGGAAKEASRGLPRCEVDAFYQEKVWSVDGTCGRPGCSAAVRATALPSKWWPRPVDDGRSVECVHGNDYPQEYHVNEMLRGAMLFDDRRGCCDAYARVAACSPTEAPGLAGRATPSNGGIANGALSCLVFLLLVAVIS